MSKHETRNILLINLGSKHTLVIKFGQFMQHYKRAIFSKKFLKKNVAWKLVPGPFDFQRILSKKESEELSADLDKF